MRKKKGPWVVTGSKVVYKNPWMKVIEDKVIRPDGKKGIFGVVYIKPGVSILPADEQGNVYLTREYHYAVERVTTEAVSGGIEKGETKIQTAKRELQEETGFTAKKWKYLGHVDPFTNPAKAPNHLYLAEGLTEGKRRLEGTEKISVVKIPFRKALRFVMEGKITHAATVALILKAREFLK